MIRVRYRTKRAALFAEFVVEVVLLPIKDRYTNRERTGPGRRRRGRHSDHR